MDWLIDKGIILSIYNQSFIKPYYWQMLYQLISLEKIISFSQWESFTHQLGKVLVVTDQYIAAIIAKLLVVLLYVLLLIFLLLPFLLWLLGFYPFLLIIFIHLHHLVIPQLLIFFVFIKRHLFNIPFVIL